MFEIPIVLFIFKRKETLFNIINVIREIKPKKIYLLSDNGRNKEEKNRVKEVRNYVESLINWDCKIIKRYSKENIGVYKNIGEGAKWVFEREEKAIFLEDDNLPEKTFFKYCEELLEKYKENKNIFWICGTNYFQDYKSKEDQSYFFTRHMLPCGWASWSGKFIKNYNGMLEVDNLNNSLKEIRNTYILKGLYFQEKDAILKTKYKLMKNIKNASWDSQVLFSLRKNNLYGICPSKNQIKNIGVDLFSTHGGNSFEKIMTKRFCGMESKALEFPLKHPLEIEIDKNFEKDLGRIRMYPLRIKFKIIIGYWIKFFLGLNKSESLTENKFYQRLKNIKGEKNV